VKIRILLLAAFIALTFVIPMLSSGGSLSVPAQGFSSSSSQSLSSSQAGSSASSQQPAAPFQDLGRSFFRVLDLSTGQVEDVSIRDYIRGALAAEMPPSFHTEALKAQAVCAHSYALFCALQQQANPDSALKGADLSADSAQNQGYLSEEQARSLWGNMFDIYWDRICEAADSVQDQILMYENSPVLAAYHSISAGQTESADAVWSAWVPYLVPVESRGDILAPGYESTVSFSADDLRQKLTEAFGVLTLPEDPVQWIRPVETSESGYHIRVAVGEQTVHGKQLRAALGLRSSNFDVVWQNGSCTFYVVGYGHGVGLSQYGADYMARQGAGYEEILLHYYPGASLAMVQAGAA
jgi:stage II sporulation protein D